jgi:hypothetical protein
VVLGLPGRLEIRAMLFRHWVGEGRHRAESGLILLDFWWVDLMIAKQNHGLQTGE